MLQLTGGQMAAACGRDGASFDGRVAGILTQRHGAIPADAGVSMIEFVTLTRERAQGIGFRAEQHLFDLIEVSLLTRNAVWDAPEFRRIVERPLLTAEEKCQIIRRRFVPERAQEPEQAKEGS